MGKPFRIIVRLQGADHLEGLEGANHLTLLSDSQGAAHLGTTQRGEPF